MRHSHLIGYAREYAELDDVLAPHFPSEYQRRHASVMEMQRRANMFTGHPKGRIAVALAVASDYRLRAMAPSADAGARRLWLGLARSAVSRAREDRMKTQPAQARILALADACVERTDALVHLFSDAATGRALEKL